jgi:hypothetical protein
VATSEEKATARAAQIRARSEDLATAALEMRNIADSLDELLGRERVTKRDEGQGQP